MHRRNTWLIAHPDEHGFDGDGVHYGLLGRNIGLKTL